MTMRNPRASVSRLAGAEAADCWPVMALGGIPNNALVGDIASTAAQRSLALRVLMAVSATAD